jgi:uncharacterized protein YgbK (DUF1537 family)
VRFLIDASLSFRIAEALQKAGHNALHVKDVLTVDAPDSVIFDHAARDDRVVVSADTDFGELLARRGTTTVTDPAATANATAPIRSKCAVADAEGGAFYGRHR